MGALDRNALFSRASAPTFHGKLLPPRSHSCRLVRGSSGGPMRVISFAPSLVLILGRVAGVTNPETNLGGQAVRPACAAVQPSISTERTCCVDLCPKLGQGVKIGTNSRLGGEK